MSASRRFLQPGWIMLGGAVLLGLLDRPLGLNLLDPMRGVLVFALLGLGLNVVTGFTGLLHLGMAAFMAIGAYAFAISTCDIYPFQIGFWPALGVTAVAGAMAGFLLGAPTLGLRGDYLAIVTLGFGEIVQDVMKNLDAITKGTQGINPLPAPSLPVVGEFGTDERPWYWLFLVLLVLAVKLCRNLERSRTGRAWLAVREDQLAASCMGIAPIPVKMYAFATGAALAAVAGGLWASLYQSTGEPGNYDFQISILALCIVIVGGMGSIDGVLVGALAMIGVANIALPKLAGWMQAQGIVNPSNVLGSPNNWKYLVFGVVLMVMMRVRPDGLLPARLERAGGGS
ncbi:MAG: branched-chain amino acid ABC transporter permease [Phycisphaerales bacterium]|jgi:branched-chain amino acid transport system permease protein